MNGNKHNLKSRSSTRIIIGIVSVILLTFIVLGVIFVAKRRQPRDPGQFYAQGVQRWNAGEYELALKYLREAANRDPHNTNYLKAAAEAAYRSRSTRDALLYARRAWDLGFRNPEMLNLMVDCLDEADRAKSFMQATNWANQLPLVKDRVSMNGEILIKFNRRDDAIRYWQQQNTAQPNPDLTWRIALAYFQTNKFDDARAVLTNSLSRGMLDDRGFELLAVLYDSAYVMPREALATIQLAKQKGFYGDQMQFTHAMILLLNLRNDEAMAVLTQLRRNATNVDAAIIKQNARLFQGFIYLAKKDREGLRNLESEAGALPSGPTKEGELNFYGGLEAMLDSKASALDYFRKASRLLPGSPVVVMLYADQLGSAGKHQEAIEMIRTLDRSPMRRWPPLLMIRARSGAYAGRDVETAKALYELHRRGYITRESAQMLRDLALKARETKVGLELQNFLEAKFPDDPDVRMFRAFLELEGQTPDKGMKILEELTAKYPESQRFKVARTRGLIEERKFQEALDELEKVDLPSSIVAPLKAMAHLGLGQLERAAEAYEVAVKDPQPAGIHMEYGKVLGLLGRGKEATNQIYLALVKQPNLVEAKLGMAVACYAAGNLPAAREYTQAILALPEARTDHNLMLLAGGELEAGQLASAVDLCNAVLLRSTNSIPARFMRGTIYGRMGRLAEAKADLQAAHKLEPASVKIKEQLAQVQMQMGELNEALALTDQIVASASTNYPVQLMRVEILGRQRRFPEANTLLSRLLPSLTPVQRSLARAHLAELQGDFNGALALLQSDLSNPAILVQWARIQIEHKADASVLDTLVRSKPPLEAWVFLANLADMKGMSGLTARLYEEALKLDTDNPGLLNNWAWSALQQPQHDPAKILAACRKAHELRPKDDNILDTYVEALLRNRRFRESISLLEANAILLNNSPQLLANLARSYEGIGESAKALQYYRRSLDQASRMQKWPVRMTKEDINYKINLLGGKRS